MTEFFGPSGPLRGTLTAPPDKSISHRAALLAAMSFEPVRITNFLRSADTDATLAAVQALGAEVQLVDDGVIVSGVGLKGTQESTSVIHVHNAGTLLRLLPGWLVGQPQGSWVIDGDSSIRKRPLDRVIEPLAQMGARLTAFQNAYAPLRIDSGAPLSGITYTLPVASAQLKSSILFAGLNAADGTTVVEPIPTRDHTERMLLAAGAGIVREGERVTLAPSSGIQLPDLAVPGDQSSAAFHIAAATLLAGSVLRIRNLGANHTRSGFINVMRRMGANISGELESPRALSPNEPCVEIEVTAASELVGTTVTFAEIPSCIDELPLIALVGCFASGETVVNGAEELKVKESDRLNGLIAGLRGLGAQIELTGDGFVVGGVTGLKGGMINAHSDHRMAMLGVIAGMVSQSGVSVHGMDTVGVSYPTFCRDLAAVAS